MKRIINYLPGLILTLLIAFAASFLENIIPIKMIGASIIALFLGICINYFFHEHGIFEKGIKFTSKRLLKFAIILLGASLNISIVLQVGKLSLSVMIFTLITCFGAGHFTGKALGLNWKMSNLISAGTGICGGSAIAAIAPVIEADEIDIAYGLSATFIFDMFMILLFPIMGKALNLSDIAYGLWTGTAVNDTSSVLAAGYAYSESAGDFATMVKLTRTLSIIPVVIIFSVIYSYIKRKNNLNQENNKLNMNKSIPWFILGFLIMVGLNSMGYISADLSSKLKYISKLFMVSALGAIGLNISFKDMKRTGIAPMLHGFIISILVVIVSFSVIYFMGEI